ncbi:hypothetical protein PC9H_001723 [Pleurotus ostreatus]|uniref:Uncharacterized protein n=2 Tax=Pleurotus ostreatus TaxID=5322 RepID=A0A067P4M8_PLEO1|nr:uncharacterized protein PC9H_001723 [Pleurotus ostreatus]KAF7441373.1 hypothetical protein PC9H_001723 [Pleurotus ostreatus]KDQ34210.1 hypothetical protein PLEOSDRAFT_1100137 [Pleurotus ostreatus PC15]
MALLPLHSSAALIVPIISRVRNVYLKCGHSQTLPDQLNQCDSPRCKFSPYHPSSCQPPACTKTCIQYRGYPEQYSPNIDGLCPACLGGAKRR